MKRYIQVLTIALVTMLSSTVFAQGKVAIVDVQKAIFSTNLAEQKMNEMQSNEEFSTLMAQAKALQEDIKKMTADLNKNRPTASAADIAQKESEIKTKEVDLNGAAQKINNIRNRTLGDVMKVMGPRAQKAVQSLIQSEGIGLLLDRSAVYPSGGADPRTGRQQVAPIILHADTSFDLTARLTAKLNESDK